MKYKIIFTDTAKNNIDDYNITVLIIEIGHRRDIYNK